MLFFGIKKPGLHLPEVKSDNFNTINHSSVNEMSHRNQPNTIFKQNYNYESNAQNIVYINIILIKLKLKLESEWKIEKHYCQYVTNNLVTGSNANVEVYS